MKTVSPVFSTPPAEATRPSFLTRIADMRFVSVSLLIHAVIVLFGGSLVIIKTITETPDFVAGDGQLITPGEADAAPAPEAPRPQELPQLKASAPPVAALSVDALTTISSLTTFQVSAAPAMPVPDGMLASLPAAGKGIGARLAGLAGGGMKGGMSGFFGSMTPKSKGVGLVGTFYDAKQTRGRKPTDMNLKGFDVLISKFVNDGWKESAFRDYYKAPHPLYTTQIFIPDMPAEEGPKAFGVEKEVQPGRWVVHYRGKISPPHDGNFRFVGAGDDFLVVRLNNKLVLDHGFFKATDWKPEQYYNYGWTRVPNGFARGEPFRAVAGEYYDLEILISERPGGRVFFCLMLEDQDAEYRKDAKGNPILPVFRLADGPMPELEKGQSLPPYEPTGPIWKTKPPGVGSLMGGMFGN